MAHPNSYTSAKVRQSHFSVEIPGQFSVKINTFARCSIPTDLILLDYRMPWMSGEDFIAEFEKLTGLHHHRTRIALFSAMPTAELAKVEIKSKHLLGIYPKPITLEIIDGLVYGMRKAQAQ
ncbi:hypothetical protein [Roseibium aggregatum]|uniref:hypothetical protein n=1 Tax=Roseibium aggregatum TaxID=187304 RepID=UPI001E5FFB6F|nr:hypothetical protein [Roseibium aggregatum]UES42121.1 hypothetical protein GFC08_29375 [Roseibium aggregatum]